VFVPRQPTTLRTAVWAALWQELSRPAWMAVVACAAVGLLVRLACTIEERGFLVHPVATARHWFVVPDPTPGLQVGRGLVVAGIGALLLVRPLTVLAVGLGALGILLVVHGLAVVVLAVPRPSSRTVLVTVRRAVTGALVVLLVGAAAFTAWPQSQGMPEVRATDVSGCNGHADLCARGYDEVSYPATHNSMSAADQPRWFLAEQPVGVLAQLDDGVRTFLIDSWYGQKTQRQDIVATAEHQAAAALQQAEEDYGPELVASALRLRRALGLEPEGPERPYLCHALCELGSTAWEPLMEQVRAWLDLNPGAVLTFIVQDEVSPADTAAVIEDAGLMPYVHTQEPGEPWPTLGDMVDSGRRVVFFMEQRGGGTAYPWLLPMEDWIQETPFDAHTAAQFSCAANRGSPEAGLFLVNHWLNNPTTRIADAEHVNTERVLGGRVRECERERGLLPNFVAVDNYDRGALFEVVDQLNGF
jgi:hypothetical protein